MKINNKSQAGSLESSDLIIYLEPADKLRVEVDSSVSPQHGDEIGELIKEELKKYKIEKVYIKVQDNGALNLTIRARLKTALKRGSENGN